MLNDKIADIIYVSESFDIPTGIAHNDGEGVINFPKLHFTEKDTGKIYWYYAFEVDDGKEKIVYDKAVIGYRIEIIDNGNGTLSFNQSSYLIRKGCEDCNGSGKAYKV